jgi:hypothetical protein
LKKSELLVDVRSKPERRGVEEVEHGEGLAADAVRGRRQPEEADGLDPVSHGSPLHVGRSSAEEIGGGRRLLLGRRADQLQVGFQQVEQVLEVALPVGLSVFRITADNDPLLRVAAQLE